MLLRSEQAKQNICDVSKKIVISIHRAYFTQQATTHISGPCVPADRLLAQRAPREPVLPGGGLDPICVGNFAVLSADAAEAEARLEGALGAVTAAGIVAGPEPSGAPRGPPPPRRPPSGGACLRRPAAAARDAICIFGVRFFAHRYFSWRARPLASTVPEIRRLDEIGAARFGRFSASGGRF